MPDEPQPDGNAPAEVDVLVAGSGAAGLTAALVAAVGGRRVLVCEASEVLGGTSAVSGGRLWVPGNRFQEDPVRDREDAAAYLESVFDPAHRAMIDAFLETGPRMLDFVERHTPHRFVACPNYPDYLPDRPGATEGGRPLDGLPYAGADPRVRVPYGYTPLTHAEWEQWRFPDRYDAALLAHRRESGIATNGVALVSALVKGVEDAGGQIVTGHRLIRLQAAAPGPRRSRSETGGGRPTPTQPGTTQPGTAEAGVAEAGVAESSVTESSVTESSVTKPGIAGSGVAGSGVAGVVGRWRVTLGAAGGEVAVVAEHVVLATGGYDQDPGLRGAYLPEGIRASASAPANVGDGLRIAQDLGAKVANLGEGWWMPMLAIPGEESDGRQAFRSLIRERGLPRQIIVDATGNRFMNESAPYHEFTRAMLQRTEPAGAGPADPEAAGAGPAGAERAQAERAGVGHAGVEPAGGERAGAGRRRGGRAFLIVDAGYRRRYPLPGAPPDASPDASPSAPPDASPGASSGAPPEAPRGGSPGASPGGVAEPGWLSRSATITGLASSLGIDPAGLVAQVTRWNEACARGVDEDFHRGEAVYDMYHGDPDIPGNPNLGPLDTAPYYGVEVLAGTIGSKGGPVTTTDGCVLDTNDRPVDGLYAAGNAAAFWTADGYPGPGATLGTGMTLAFRAGERCIR